MEGTPVRPDMISRKKTPDDEEKNVQSTVKPPKFEMLEQVCFFLGFIFPPAWFIGSSDCCKCRDPLGPAALAWKKRCRIAATLFLTIGIGSAAVITIVSPSTFGLRTGNSSGTQTSSASDKAIRPGVPMNGTTTWQDAAAGVSWQ